MDPTSLLLLADAQWLTPFAIVGGVLCVIALAVAFFGLRREEDFPSTGAMRGLGALMIVGVIATGVLAVVVAREEQAIRREENVEAGAEEGAGAEEREDEPGEEREGSGGEPEDELALGSQVFAEQGCGGCHVLADAGSAGQTGPDLDERIPGQSAEQVRTAIVDPDADLAPGFPEGVMPGNYGEILSDEELDALVAYIRESAG